MTATIEADLFDCRVAYAETLIELAGEDERITVVVNDSVGSSNLTGFKQAFPDRLINVGIAEQDMVGIAAGLANGGRIPFVSAAGCFLTARAMEQIKIDAGYANNNIKLCAMSPGMAYGELGATHHSIEDISWLRAIPNIHVAVPADPVETAAAIRWAASVTDPVYLRVSRMLTPAVFEPGHRYLPGKATVLRAGRDVTLIANGTVVHRALDAASALADDGIDARVLSMASVKPLDEAAVLAAAAETGAVVTAEEGCVSGGLGAAVASLLAQERPTPMRIVGVPGVFAPTGSEAWLMDHFGISAVGIADAARTLVARR